MSEFQKGKELVDKLGRQAYVFQINESTWDWIRGTRLAGTLNTGITMATEKGLGWLLEKGISLLPRTGGGIAGAGSGIAGGGLAFMGIMGGLADIGKASLQGKALNARRMEVAAYVNKYVDTVAGYAISESTNQPYKPEVTHGQLEILKDWERMAINDVHKALGRFGENDGRTVLRYLKNSYGEPEAIANALRGTVLNHSLQQVSPKLRQFITGINTGSKAYVTAGPIGEKHTYSAERTGAGVATLGSRSLLKEGMRGGDVREMQKRLGVKADGIFGPQTKSALKSYQERYGLKVDGIAGRQTRGSLFGSTMERTGAGVRYNDPVRQAAQQLMIGRTGAGVATLGSKSLLKEGMRGEDVREMQKRLGVKADGIFGPQTKSALKSYQERYGLKVDGIAGRQTLGSMFGSTMERTGAGVRYNDPVRQAAQQLINPKRLRPF